MRCNPTAWQPHNLPWERVPHPCPLPHNLSVSFSTITSSSSDQLHIPCPPSVFVAQNCSSTLLHALPCIAALHTVIYVIERFAEVSKVILGLQEHPSLRLLLPLYRLNCEATLVLAVRWGTWSMTSSSRDRLSIDVGGRGASGVLLCSFICFLIPPYTSHFPPPLSLSFAPSSFCPPRHSRGHHANLALRSALL